MRQSAWMDTWLDREVLNLRDGFRRRVAPIPIPESILDDEPVMAWFRRIKGLDLDMHAQLRFLILRKSRGFEPDPLLLEQVKV